LRHDPALAAPEHRCAAHSQLLAHTPRPLRPLPVPQPDAVGELSGDFEEVAAVRVFLDRARAAQPGYAPETTEAADIVRLCRLLRGDPLEIELAASQLPHRSVRQLVQIHQLKPG
jgi:predicted ATPase